MKTVSLLAGVAALALSAVAAQAGEVYHATATTGSVAGPAVNVPGAPGVYLLPNSTIDETYNQAGYPANIGRDYLKAISPLVIDDSTAQISMIEIKGLSADNNGTASTSDGATFTLKGAVSTDCAYYSGSSNSQTIDFGTIGIFASDNTGPAAAFDMTAAANVTIDSNLAGCNTSNRVTLSKSDVRGLVNNSAAGYDTNVFQANLPFSVTANYTAGAVGVAGAASPTSLVLAAGSNSVTAQHGAWKSPMALNVNIPVPSKSLLAGAYQGDLTVNIAAF
ncbi:hypothetical protein [Brevundimonas sp.]|uniref:hypothetical protein n=1 Tax=Brevundimonas sp. TaxID=1871086 RepID=UPI003D6D43F2